MNPAGRRAQLKKIQADLARAFDDEEAVPPEWLDITNHVREATATLRSEIKIETERFVSEADISKALARRARFTDNARRRIEDLNSKIRRLNLIAPHSRFTRRALNTDELLRPLFRSERRPS